MANKRGTKAATDELDELFEGIGDDTATKRGAAPASASRATTVKAKPNDDILAELENQLGEVPSRPHTPRVNPTAKTTPKPTAGGERTSEDRPSAPTNLTRKSGESTRSFHASFTPSTTSSGVHDLEKQSLAVDETQTPIATSGGGWWGLISTATATATAAATAAKQQAEAAYKEIQQNEEAKKWADQVRGNVGALRGLGGNIAQNALPTFTNILHTLAPPISSHERLLIHITHDLVGYPSLDPLIHGVFSRVMAQVEGGDLLVIQRGHENAVKSPSAVENAGNGSGGGGGFFSGTLPGQNSPHGWRDGPWWRDVGSTRDMSIIKGLSEGTKLCRASAEGYSTDFFASSGGIDAARQRALDPVSESNPVRSSDLFLAVQAIDVGDSHRELFAGPASTTTTTATGSENAIAEESDKEKELVCFAVYVFDPVHDIHFSTISQTIPAKWIRWLDAAMPLTPATSAEDENGAASGIMDVERVPEEIRDIIETGGVDPREWVAEWIEETLSLATGIVAQRYVARRMGVGEGGIGKGKRRMEDIVEDGAGEVARAGIL